MIFKDVLIKKSGVKNPNGFIYTEKVLKDVVRQVNEKTAFGGIGYNTSSTLNIQDVSHSLFNAHLIDGDMKSDIEVFKTPKGIYLQNFINTFGINRLTWVMTLITSFPKDNEYCLPVTIVSIDAVPNEVKSEKDFNWNYW